MARKRVEVPPTIADKFIRCQPTFTPRVVESMRVALSEAWQELTNDGVHLEGMAEVAVRDVLAIGIIRQAEVGERDHSRLRDAALEWYAKQQVL